MSQTVGNHYWRRLELTAVFKVLSFADITGILLPLDLIVFNGITGIKGNVTSLSLSQISVKKMHEEAGYCL